MTKLNKLHEKMALMHLTALCCYMGGDNSGPESVSDETIDKAEDALNDGGPESEPNKEAGEAQGGTVTGLTEEPINLTSDAIESGDPEDLETLPTQDELESEQTDLSEFEPDPCLGMGPDEFESLSVRGVCNLLENVIAYKMQQAGKRPGSFVAMEKACQEFNQANTEHPLIDKRGK